MTTIKAFLINLDRDRDRLEHMGRQLDACGLAFERIPAVMGNAVPSSLAGFFASAAPAGAEGLRPGEIGCYASHLLIARRIVDEGIDAPVLVLEDDLDIGPGLTELLVALPRLPVDWDIIRLSNPPKSATQDVMRFGNGARLVRYWRVPNNTGAYLINRRGADKFLSYSAHRFRAVDEDLRRPWEHGLVTYGVVPPPVTSNIFDSSIDAISGERALPARKRFPKVRGETRQALRYRLQQFGVFGAAMMGFKILLSALSKRLGRR